MRSVDRTQSLALMTDQYIGVQSFAVCCLVWRDLMGVLHSLGKVTIPVK